jgi:chromosome segregation ATPase
MRKRETLGALVREQLHKHGLLLEGMTTQNRATIEAVENTRTVLEERIDRFDRESRERDADLGAAIKATQADVGVLKTDVAGLRTDVAGLKTQVGGLQLDVRELKVGVQQNSVDIRELSARVAVVERLDERVTALERKAG